MEDFLQDLNKNGLFVLGSCTAKPSDNVPKQNHQILLLAPDEPKFWEIFKHSDEYQNNMKNPLDRWSKRVVDEIAIKYGAAAHYPNEGPPWYPFIDWALRSKTCFLSPSNLLVHGERGLFISFRAALSLPFSYKIGFQKNPCQTCQTKPCQKACPVDALTQAAYDVPKCIGYIKTSDEKTCLKGCLVRRACPIGQDHRTAEQSMFHMEAFYKNNQ